MRRRSIVLLAGGVLALALAPPVFGAGDSTTPPPGQSAASTTTTTAYASGAAPTSTTATMAPSSTSTTATTAPAGAGATTTTTAPATDAQSPAPSGNCAAPVQTHEAAPAEGESVVYPAGDAGEVEISRISTTELEVVDAVANDGWTAEVTGPTGPRVKVRFVEDATSSKTRFAASMDQHGDEIHIRVEDCS